MEALRHPYFSRDYDTDLSAKDEVLLSDEDDEEDNDDEDEEEESTDIDNEEEAYFEQAVKPV